MKVQPTSLAQESLQIADASRRRVANTAAQRDSTQVALSATSVALGSGDSDVNLAKVAALRAAIQNGELVIDPSRIADGLLASVRELINDNDA